MDKEKLHRFFAGMTSIEEGMSVKNWMESSEENKRVFFKERELFDAIILSDTQITPGSLKPFSYRGILIRSMKVAAVAAITLTISYVYRTFRSDNGPVAMNTIMVPAGQRTCLTLSDGTTVWLNARTTLQYPVSFNQKNRTVVLRGEAFFDVEKNEDAPFIVQTEKYNIEVLGTEFNVEAYPDEPVFGTALMEGRVKISSSQSPAEAIFLKPDEKAYLKDGKLLVEKVDDDSPYRWKEGLICFKDESFQTIMEQFEKYYGVEIIINNSRLLDHFYTGKFRQSDGIDYALRVLQKTIHFNYEKHSDKQIIYIN